MEKLFVPSTLILLLVWSLVIPARAQETDESLRLNNAGVSATEQHKYSEAISRFQQALKLSPSYVPARENLVITHVNYALKLVSLRNLDEALRQFHEAAYLDPSSVFITQQMNGFIRDKLNLNPHKWEDRIKLGNKAESKGDLRGAVVEYRLALKLRNLASTHLMLGHVYKSLGEKKLYELECLAAEQNNENVHAKR